MDVDTLCQPTKAEITWKDILTQVGRDLFDKEVQSAATYSYLWIADQMGHLGLGLVVAFALSWIVALLHGMFAWFGFPQLDPWLDHPWPLIVGCVLVAYWEFNAFRAYNALATGLFPPDTAMLAQNAVVAADYMVLGVAAGFAWMHGTLWQVGVTLAAVIVAVALAPPWLRQKIVWQKAGLPFLFRLCDFLPTIDKSAAEKLQSFIDTRARADTTGPVVVIYGPLGAGKTSLVCGIGTECAFDGSKVRYVTFDKLAQMAFADRDDPGPDNIVYWPWTESEVLLIDDVDTDRGPGDEAYLSFDEFRGILERQFKQRRFCLGRRMSVWVLGARPAEEAKLWADEIVRVCTQTAGAPELLLVECKLASIPKRSARALVSFLR